MNNNSELKFIVIDDTVYPTRYTSKYEKKKNFVARDPKKIFASIPGVIDEINIKKGQKVKARTVLLILEAMKMKNHLSCPSAGIIKEIHVKQGQAVTKGELLIELE